MVDWIFLTQDSDRRRGGGGCEHGNEPAGSTKCGEFLEYLRNDLFLNKDSVR